MEVNLKWHSVATGTKKSTAVRKGLGREENSAPFLWKQQHDGEWAHGVWKPLT